MLYLCGRCVDHVTRRIIEMTPTSSALVGNMYAASGIGSTVAHLHDLLSSMASIVHSNLQYILAAQVPDEVRAHREADLVFFYYYSASTSDAWAERRGGDGL